MSNIFEFRPECDHQPRFTYNEYEQWVEITCSNCRMFAVFHPAAFEKFFKRKLTELDVINIDRTS